MQSIIFENLTANPNWKLLEHYCYLFIIRLKARHILRLFEVDFKGTRHIIGLYLDQWGYYPRGLKGFSYL